MRKFVTALLCATSLGIGAASAADLPARVAARPVVAPPPAPVYSWTGCFIGGNIGGGWARNSYTDPLAVPPDDNLSSHTASGIVGGGQIGCDYQAGPWVIGVAGMWDAADLHASHLAIGDFYDSRVPWFATATARLGYAVQPNFLLYVRGGAAWVRDNETKTDQITGLQEGTASVTRTGWTVGGGAEWLIMPNVSLFAEYNYLDFGTRRVDYTNLEIPPVPATFPLDIRQNVQAVLVGFNVRFGGPAVPLATRY